MLERDGRGLEEANCWAGEHWERKEGKRENEKRKGEVEGKGKGIRDREKT